MIACKCRELSHMEGVEGQEYARLHLKKIKVDSEDWKILYQCPDTGRYWKRWLPYPEAQGGGPPDLVQITSLQAKEEFAI